MWTAWRTVTSLDAVLEATTDCGKTVTSVEVVAQRSPQKSRFYSFEHRLLESRCSFQLFTERSPRSSRASLAVALLSVRSDGQVSMRFGRKHHYLAHCTVREVISFLPKCIFAKPHLCRVGARRRAKWVGRSGGNKGRRAAAGCDRRGDYETNDFLGVAA